jgi:hypothetical protein
MVLYQNEGFYFPLPEEVLFNKKGLEIFQTQIIFFEVISQSLK